MLRHLAMCQNPVIANSACEIIKKGPVVLPDLSVAVWAPAPTTGIYFFSTLFASGMLCLLGHWWK